MATELATAYLSLIPTLKGAGKSIQNELDGINVDPSGKKMGKQLGDGLTDGAKSGSSGIISALGGIAKVAGPALAAIGFSQLVGEAAAATDATQKFKSTLDFAGLGTPEIEALSKSTRKYADETVYALSDIQNITAQLAANSVPNYDKLAEAAGNLNAVAGGNAETFKSVGMVMTQTAGAGKLTTENWNQLADAIPGASGKLQEAMLKNGAYTGNFRKAMEQGQISAEEFNQAIMQLGFEDAAVKAAKSTETFEGAMGNLQAAAVGGISDLLAKLQPAITGVMNGLVPVVEGAFGAISAMVMSAMPAIQNAISVALSAIGAIWNAIWPTLSIVVGYVFSMIQTVVTTVLGVIQGIIQVVTSAIQGDWSGVWEGIKAIASSVWEGIKSTVSNGINAAKSVISSVLSAIKGAWDSCWNGIKSFFSSIWDGIKSAAANGVNNVYNTVIGIKDKITGFFSGAGSWLVNAGKNILQGLWDGISGALGWLGDKLAGIGDFIVQHKGPPSYDAVMLVKNGELIMDGLLRGMANGWGDVEDFVKSRNTSLSASYSVTARANRRSYTPSNQNTELYGLLRDIRAAMPESMTPREFRRAVAACG